MVIDKLVKEIGGELAEFALEYVFHKLPTWLQMTIVAVGIFAILCFVYAFFYGGLW